MKRIVAISLLLLAGCASQRGPTDTSPLAPEDFEPQLQCARSWDRIVEEWVSAGGRIESSVRLTQVKLQTGPESTLSSIFIDTWKHGSNAQGTLRDKPGAAFVRAARGHVPSGCASSVWLVAALHANQQAISKDVLDDLRRESGQHESTYEPEVVSWLVDSLMTVQ